MYVTTTKTYISYMTSNKIKLDTLFQHTTGKDSEQISTLVYSAICIKKSTTAAAKFYIQIARFD